MAGRVFSFYTCALLVLLCTGLWQPALAQTAILTGRVVDDETGEVLPGANVFLDQTRWGTATDSAGVYTLERVAPGSYKLVISMLGFALQTVEVEIKPETASTTVDVRLTPTIEELGEVEVTERRPRGWQRDLRRFKEAFIGSSPNARRTEILNPYVLDFETKDGVFAATAPAPLEIENRALGYRITLVLTDFRLDENAQMLYLHGPFHFDELEPEDEEEARRWQTNRERTFRGSLKHVLWSMVRNNMLAQDIIMKRDDRTHAPYSHEAPQFEPVEAPQIMEPTRLPYLFRLRFQDYLYIDYRDEKSWIEMRGGEAMIHESGYIYGLYSVPDALTVHGALARRRMADLLPRDFDWPPDGAHVPPLPVFESDPPLAADTNPPQDATQTFITETGLPQDPALVYPAETPSLEPVVAALQTQNWKQALHRLKGFLGQNPDDLEARYYRAIASRELATYRTLTEFEHWQQGIDDFTFILARDSTYRDVLHQLALYSRIPQQANALRASNVSLTDALRLGHAQIRLQPDVATHQFRLFSLYYRFLNRTDTWDALVWLRAHPSDYADFFIGEALRRNGQLEAADAHLAALLTRSLAIPRQPVLLARARIQYALGHPEKAQMLVEQAIDDIQRPLHAAFVFEDVKYLVDADELAAYRTLQTSDAYRAFFNAFWARRDPLPAHPVNLRMAEHYRRLRVAEQEYAYDGFRLWHNNPDQTGELDVPDAYALNGEFNDRGLVYIRLGEPTERIATVTGEADLFKSSAGMTGEQGVFAPKDQSYRANWVPNESWRYADLGLDFHFVIAEGGDVNNWRLTPALTNYEMLQDRMQWGGVYTQMARAASMAVEHQSLSGPPIIKVEGNKTLAGHNDQNVAPASQSAFSIIDMAEGRNRMADSSRTAVTRGLTMDRHTWTDDVEPLPFAYVAAAFRGDDGLADLYLFYALPTGQISRDVKADTLNVEVGVALHDSAWNATIQQTSVLPLPARDDPSATTLQSIRLSIPPDAYHLALHSRPLGTNLLGSYTFDKRVPDFSAARLALSDVILAYDITLTTEAEPSSLADLRVVANPFQRFALDQIVHVYFEIYNLTYGAGDRTHYSVEYALLPEEAEPGLLHRLFRRDDRTALTLKTSSTGSTTSSIEYTEIDASQVEPGRYMLRVTVTNETTGASITQEVPVEFYKP